MRGAVQATPTAVSFLTGRLWDPVAETREHGVVGFVKGYRPPKQPDTIFVWQIGVSNELQGHGLGGRMLMSLAERCARPLSARVRAASPHPAVRVAACPLRVCSSWRPP